MEQGTIKSFDKNSGIGMIGRAAEVDVRFYADSILGNDRAKLKQGDLVWFEVGNIETSHYAVNIRKVF